MPENKSEIAKNNKPRPWMILIWVIVFFVVLDIGVRVYFSQPDLLTRNVAKGIDALPYLWNQMDRHKGTNVAWVGASVLQGFLNVDNGRTFPDLVERELRKTDKYADLKGYNLAAAGDNFGDHYCILWETLKHDPDLIVVAIHFKSFSAAMVEDGPMRRPELIPLIDDPGKRKIMTKRYQIDTPDFYRYKLTMMLGKPWAFYRYRNLMVQLATQESDPPTAQFFQWYKGEMNFISPEAQEVMLNSAEHHSTDYLWKLLPERLISRNHKIAATLDFTDSNINWQTFKDMCKLGKKKHAKMLFYLTPINREFVEAEKFFDWNLLTHYKQAVARVVQANGHMLVDVTSEVDSAFFSDTDHINSNGHAQLARRMTYEVQKALERKR